MRIVPLIGLFFLPLCASADVIITEVMYDLEGTDTAREWIEVLNNGSNAVDLSTWKLFENETNHALTTAQGSGTLSGGSYAVIADNASAFLLDHPSYMGSLFDSAFSLNNTGETIALKDNETIIDEVTYSSTQGALGDGKSLQLSGSSLISGVPTPGGPYAGGGSRIVPSQQADDDESAAASGNEQETPQKQDSSVTSPRFIHPEWITIEAGGDRTVGIGDAEFFEAHVYDPKGNKLEAARVLWNFGNGTVIEGQKVWHQYDYSGEYVVAISASISAGRIASSARLRVTAEPVRVAIVAVTDQAVVLKNESNRELDLSHWSLRAGDKHFLFPKDTILLPHMQIAIPHHATGFYGVIPSAVAVVYPSGSIASSYVTPPPTTARVYAQTVAQPVAAAESPSLDEVSSESGRAPVITEGLAASVLGNPAAVADSEDRETNNLAVWLVALMLFIGAGLVALLLIPPSPANSVVSGYTIVEADPEQTDQTKVSS